MKRYRIDATLHVCRGVANAISWLDIYTADEGQWIKHEDVEKLKTENTALKKMNMYISSMAVEGRQEAPVCNCEVESAKMREFIKAVGQYSFTNMGKKDWWICPAHGYKRL